MMGINFRNPTPFFLSSLFFFILCSLSSFCFAADTLSQGQSIKDGENITSADQRFVLGFFSPGNSTFRYVGIWYNKIPTQSFIWVANRENPISGKDGVLTIGNNGNLMVLDGNGSSVWSSNASVVSGNSSTAILMSSTGNLILSSNDSVGDAAKALWQSFDDPTDTYLPDMKVHMNVDTGENHVFTSWRSENDPSPGRYSMGVDPRGSPQIVIWEGQTRHWRSGHWNGLMFTGVPSMNALYLYGFKLFDKGDGNMYFTYTLSNTSDIVRFLITSDGHEEQLMWEEDEMKWSLIQSQPDNVCGEYNKCGTFGKCYVNGSSICSCIEGFVAKDLDQWNRGNWSGGCVRRTQLQCETNSSLIEGGNGEEDGFVEVDGMKLPDFVDYVGSDDINACRDMCLNNCSCKAYAYVSGISCMMWSGDLVDLQQFADGGNTLYIRLANSELGGGRKITKFVIIATVVVGAFFLCVTIWLLWRFGAKLKAFLNPSQKNNELPMLYARRSEELSTDLSGPDDLRVEGQHVSGAELSFLDFNTVALATNNFSNENKLGQGGFGPVYKGKLPWGQEIAVKRLSRKSGQGLEEFKNEITLIAKLQHRNLVRLLGYCIQGEEKMLLYEYMSNKSLDTILFDTAKQARLDWRKRFTIIEGIARGLLYLHRDSRLRIIHRDLKASNILLDEEMNPKISDFGMARIFGGNQNEANTNRVVGTYGYMAPEYAMEGLFSVKSDVYSFGVLILEIITGRRNTSFRSPEHSNIIGYAWDLWDGDKAMEMIDPSIADSCCQNEVLRCIQVGMLCVQDMAFDRPIMSSVLLMLEGQSTSMQMPRRPSFTSMRRSSIDMDESWKESRDIVSSNDVTISAINGR
ncbi:G-type lectin S-receptor-like serine/threonine-protein kinase B120 [Cornus florida]|uniref:G-type lectin S-receptor-like serine/threonine-protein kinase B120 n=1 Tax=Cornus florida TaxID=4283 RepID=UPI00289E6DF0|nr:G-type lectin S-receptor-like serine/threonine-protein kinase B120 [Cornus florida]